MSEQQKTDLALAALDALAAIWAAKVGLQEMVNNFQAMPRLKMLEAIEALAKQAYIEGAYEGRTSPRPASSLRLAVERLCSQTGESPDEFERWLCDGGLSQMALSHFTATTAAPTLFSADRQPPPDEEGFFTHPDFNAIFRHDEPSQDEVVKRLALFGWEADYVSGDDLLDEKALDYDVRGWKPEPPAGDGWRLISVFDTEDGPYALFVRHQQPASASAHLRDQLTAEEAAP